MSVILPVPLSSWLALRLFTMLFPAGCEALACNVVSALSCAAAAAFLCRCVRMLLSLYVTSHSTLAKGVAGVCAGLVWAVTGSVWTVAVETEVYGAAALMSFFTLWCALRWRTGDGSFRFAALFAFSIGLTSGVHWLRWLLLGLFHCHRLGMALAWNAYRSSCRMRGCADTCVHGVGTRVRRSRLG